MIKNNAEMYKHQVEFYKQLAGFRAGGIGYLPAPAPIIQNRIEHVGSNVARDTYAADRSPGAAVGKENTALIESSSITIGSTLDEIRAQVTGLNELVELVAQSDLQEKDDAVRHLINAREELTERDLPDRTHVGKFLDRAKRVLAFAQQGTELYTKAKEVLGLFDING